MYRYTFVYLSFTLFSFFALFVYNSISLYICIYIYRNVFLGQGRPTPSTVNPVRSGGWLRGLGLAEVSSEQKVQDSRWIVDRF